jgi:uncharacterized membrane protein
MALAGFIMSTWSTTLLDSLKLVKDEAFYLVPLGVAYAFAWLLGLLGNKHLDASVVSPLENIDGALTAIICYYYLLTGYIHPSNMIGVMDVIAAMLIIIGIVLIGIEEQALKSLKKPEKTLLALSPPRVNSVAKSKAFLVSIF